MDTGNTRGARNSRCGALGPSADEKVMTERGGETKEKRGAPPI